MVAINPFSALSSVGQAANDRISIAENFDTFLSLLTTQLQNQNPLDPLDMNQFTQQLVQFTEVEQSVKLNENLEQMVQLTAANTITNAVGYIGKQVTTSGATAQLRGGTAAWTVTLEADSPSTVFTVKNSSGVPVYTETKPVSGGSHVFAWDGRTDTGTRAPDGVYTLSVVAQNDNGSTLNATTEASGIIDGVDMSGDEPVLLSGGWEIRLEDITSIKAAPSS
ncbi:MAG: flagellar hook capping FlgD N-terminal domain-containing protein [Methyloligellaceae bacterium]